MGSVERLEELYKAAIGSWIVLYEPATFEELGIRLFALLDPSSITVEVSAQLDPRP